MRCPKCNSRTECECGVPWITEVEWKGLNPMAEFVGHIAATALHIDPDCWTRKKKAGKKRGKKRSVKAMLAAMSEEERKALLERLNGQKACQG